MAYRERRLSGVLGSVVRNVELDLAACDRLVHQLLKAVSFDLETELRRVLEGLNADAEFVDALIVLVNQIDLGLNAVLVEDRYEDLDRENSNYGDSKDCQKPRYSSEILLGFLEVEPVVDLCDGHSPETTAHLLHHRRVLAAPHYFNYSLS